MNADIVSLFDANAGFGHSNRITAEFPDIASRLRHMDRLGVSRALVWNNESIQHNANASNEAMLAAIAAEPQAAGRLFPALTVSSLAIYEKGGLELLERQFTATPCRALRFVNAMRRQSLMQLAPVIERLECHRPFIIFGKNETDARDIISFSGAFPDVPLIMTEATWSQHVILFDLLSRCENLLCDISFMHTFRTMEMLVERFGAERLVFALGNKSHQGAAIAALGRADISSSDKRKVAHGNLDRLTGLPPTPASDGDRVSNNLWRSFINGAPLEPDVVDAHGHLGPSSGYVMEHQQEVPQLEACIAALRKTGVKTFILSGMRAIMGDPVTGNPLLEKLLQPHIGFIHGYFAFNPLYAAELEPMMEKAFEGSVFLGFKTLCDYWQVPITDPRFEPMWKFAERHRLPVLSHTWDGAYDTPAMFADLVKRFPDVPFLLAHSGGGEKGRKEAEELAREFPNAYLEWCGSFANTCSWEETLKIVNPDQIIFGTDAMPHSFDWETGRLLSLDIPEKTLIKVLGANMRRILSMRR